MEECRPLPIPTPSDRSNVEPSSLNLQPSPAPLPSTGVENCYVFKSRLQEYAQKVGFPTPVYQTVKEGPSHEPIFKSVVILNDAQYESLPGFFNRKAAEQSAAEVALIEIRKSGQMTENIPIVHETGLCKNLLQEYAQKMNYAIPSYKCIKQEGVNPYICTVEIGGIQYIGAAARTKKEAEIKAARIALLAIRDCSEMSSSQYTVLPIKKKVWEPEPLPKSDDQLKPKKPWMKKKWNSKRKFPRNKGETALNPNIDDSLNSVDIVEDASMVSNRDKNVKDEPQSKIRKLISSVIETTERCKDEKLEGPVRLKVENFEESRDVKIADAESSLEISVEL